MGSNSLTRDPCQAPSAGSVESQPLDHQEVPLHLFLFLLFTLLLPQDILTLSSSTESEGESGTSRKPTTGQTSATAVDSDDIQTISSGSEGDDFEDKKNMSGSLEEFVG